MPTVGPWNRKWPQAADAIRGQIADGTLQPGTVARIADLCPVLGVQPRTAGRALQELAGEGLVELKHSIGYVVLPRPGTAPGPPG